MSIKDRNADNDNDQLTPTPCGWKLSGNSCRVGARR